MGGRPVKRLALVALAAASVAGAQSRPLPVLTLEPRADSTTAEIREFAPPPIYFRWWQEIARCEGLPLPLEQIGAIRFFEVRDSSFTPTGERGRDLAATRTDVGQVYLATPYVWDEQAVKHEMVHNLLDWAGYDFGGFHPAEFFDRCGLVPWRR
jgi:hypothetical protein